MLIATIGENDPISLHGPMAALRAALHDRPELIFLVHTNATLGQAEETRSHIARGLPDAGIRLLSLPIDDPTDTEFMLDFLHERWVHLRHEFADAVGRPIRADDVHVSIAGSSGTRHMGLALTLSAELAFPWAQHWTAIRPDVAVGSAVPPSRDPCLRSFRAGLLRHEHESREGFRLLASCHFHEAVAKFEERLRLAPLSPDRGSASPIQVAARLAQTFRDLADSDVRPALQGLFAEPVPATWAARMGAVETITAWLRRIEAWYSPIEQAIHTPNDLADPWPAELVAIALRERAAGRLPLAVMKLQTAFEVAMQVRLTQLTGRPGAPAREAWDRTLDRLRRLDAGLDRQLSVRTDRIREASALARARNDLVHRGRTLHRLEEVLNDGHRFVDELLHMFEWRTSADAPTRPEEIHSAATLLADWAGLPLH
jgi:hypothetical protein